MATKPRQPDRDFAASGDANELADVLNLRYGHLPAEEIIAVAIDLFDDAGGIAATSSFGADSAALLHLIAEAEPGLPVTFLDTGQHFGETLQYRDQLAEDLGLTNIVIVKPLDDALTADDPDGILHQSDTDRCCAIRKVEPMARAVAPYRAWFTGRKRGQASTRAEMPVFEAVGPRIRVNPLARWTTGGSSRLHAPARSAPEPAGGVRLPVDRVLSLHKPGEAWRRPALRPLGRTGEDRMRHSSARP